MNTIKINDFGPIHEASIDLEKICEVFIGAQASGKSTICKIVYFCQKIRDYTLDFLMDAKQFTDNHQNEYFNNYMKYLTKQFIGLFGKTTHMRKFHIVHHFGQKKIQIQLNKDGYVRFAFDRELKDGIADLIRNASEMFLHGLNSDTFNSLLDHVTALGIMRAQLHSTLKHLFENDMDLIYIPAGRSLLATMSEKLQEFSVSDMDLAMEEFIHLIGKTRSRFGSRIPDIARDYTRTVKGQINNSSVETAYDLIRKIFKADYTSENDEEKIYYDDRHWVKLMYGSSGQQEVLWILMLVFIILLEEKRSFVVIEEPEAHLFPIAQKDVVNLISLMVNTTGSRVIITTHSPYILTSLNILLYSQKVEGNRKGTGKVVIPKNLRVFFEQFAAFKVENPQDRGNSLESLMDAESHMISTAYIDEVSSITNRELEYLLDQEI